MSLAKLLPLAIEAALMLMVLSLGLKATFADLFYLFRRPGQLIRALLSMDVIVPLIAVLLASKFAREQPVKIALITLALAPLPATFPKKALKAGCKVSYTVGLMAAITLIAIVFIPIALELIGRTFGITVQMSAAAAVPHVAPLPTVVQSQPSEPASISRTPLLPPPELTA